MQYLLLIYQNEENMANQSDSEKQQIMAAYGTFTQEIVESGSYKGGNALLPTATATTVQVRAEKLLTTDGPFAETKEQLGGYYLIEAKDIDEAINIASRIPTAKSGSIEVRPIMVFDEPS